jgi:hypothetical protein
MEHSFFEITPGMPTGQHNANLSEGLAMRVGIPHKGGSLAFHAFNEGYPVMVSANAFWDMKKGQFRVPEISNLADLDVALDSAGFVAVHNWQQKGQQNGMAGIFPWRYEQYLELASIISPTWYSQPDLCCEPQIASSQAEIDFRVDATATLLEGTLQILYAWQNELAKSCSAETVASLVRPPVPVLQGWAVGDYQRSLDLMMQVWERWQPWLASPALIGVGSVCRRSLSHPDFGLHAILAGLEGRLPQDSRLHMFGVKGAVLKDLKMMSFIGSADSMAYDYGARIKARKEGRSNNIAHRSAEMTQWMQAAARKIMPAVGDQHRLMFNF